MLYFPSGFCTLERLLQSALKFLSSDRSRKALGKEAACTYFKLLPVKVQDTKKTLSEENNMGKKEQRNLKDLTKSKDIIIKPERAVMVFFRL